MLAKSLSFLAGADAAGIVLGARVPIILTSRADGDDPPRLVRGGRAGRPARRARPRQGRRGCDDRRDRWCSTPARRASSSHSTRRRRARAASRAARSRASAPRRTSSAKERPAPRSQNAWADGTKLGHDGALEQSSLALRATRRHRRSSGVGHRVVHGGTQFDAAGPRRRRGAGTSSKALVPLAPLHQPHNLAAIRRIARAPPRAAAGRLLRHRLPPQPAGARRNFALPRELTDAGVRRYGFHGLSYEYIASSCRSRPDAGARPGGGRPSRQRRQPVRASQTAGASPAPWASPRSTG